MMLNRVSRKLKPDTKLAILLEDFFHQKYEPSVLSNCEGPTRGAYARNLKLHILPRLGKCPVSDITVEDVQAVIDATMGPSRSHDEKYDRLVPKLGLE